ncbi:MAG: LarC family nickel insertion protein, partial [Nitrospirae bacterium]|nr:LarC family nickel insertion protein [Nitrospirota bacterium]
MKLAYFDCFSGASGDMILGALVDAGLPLATLQERLALLDVEGYEVNAYPVTKKGLRATKVDVVIPRKDLPARDFRDMREIIEKSGLTPTEKEQGLRIFTRLAEAEARVHDCPVEEIHFHELGALDTLVDVMGAVIGFQALGIEKIVVSPLDVGGGMTEAAHGRLPVPGPATAELLKEVPIYSSGI